MLPEPTNARRFQGPCAESQGSELQDKRRLRAQMGGLLGSSSLGAPASAWRPEKRTSTEGRLVGAPLPSPWREVRHPIIGGSASKQPRLYPSSWQREQIIK